MERETGVEPATSSLGSWHSTTELLPLVAVLRISKRSCSSHAVYLRTYRNSHTYLSSRILRPKE